MARMIIICSVMATNVRIRQLLRRIVTSNYITSYRNLTMTPPNLEKALKILKTNPYYDKYAERIAALQKTSPEEFMSRVEQQQRNKEEEKKKMFASVDTRQFSSALNPKEKLRTETAVTQKSLSDILKIDLIKDKEPVEIQHIWAEYHKNKEVISAIIPNDLYASLQIHMMQYPVFLFPLPRSQGYEFILCQSYAHTVHFTPLLAYQVHKENAPECLTMVHYTELSEKGIVLMHGAYDKNVLNGQEAQCLANQFQMYYSGKHTDKLQLLQTFTQSPDTFKHMDLVSQLENIPVT